MLRGLVLVAVAGIFLAGCSAETPGAPAGNVVEARTDVNHGERFTPADLAIATGETVTFRIVSGAHTVDFEDTDGVSSPHQSELAPGSEVEVAFSKAGVYRYYCQYHLPGMKGTVTVR